MQPIDVASIPKLVREITKGISIVAQYQELDAGPETGEENIRLLHATVQDQKVSRSTVRDRALQWLLPLLVHHCGVPGSVARGDHDVVSHRLARNRCLM
jgi:hypothetical protein